MRLSILAIAAIASISLTSCTPGGKDGFKVIIVKPQKAEFLEERAADELQKYAKAMTGQAPAIVTDETAGDLAGGKTYFIIGGPDRNTLASKVADKNGPAALKKTPSHEDGFVVASAGVGGAKVVAFAGRKPIGCLYAVYDYLERDCGVGFFQDGEHVPHLAKLPAEGIERVEQPRFDNRMNFCWNGHEGIKKFHSYWWTLEEWKREFDWMAKRRMNLIRIDLWYYTHFVGDAYEQAFPEIGPEVQGEGYVSLAGFPHDWSWPPKYRREMMQEAFKYARSQGIRFIYCMDYAAVPLRLLKAHPDYKYMPGDQYGPSRQIDPRDPHACEVEKKYLAKVIELFGTDHLYLYTPYAEIDVGGGSPEKNLQMRVEAAKGIMKMLSDVDPKGIWVTDTWDILTGGRWNPPMAKTYFDSFPTDKMYIYETGADVGPIYREYSFWFGKPWAYGVLHSLAGADHLHGNPEALIAGINDAAACKTCTGVFMVPEMTHHNIMFWDLVTHLAWQPKGVTLEAFLKDYVSRRYGRELQAPMVEAWAKVVKATYHSSGLADTGYDAMWYKWRENDMLFNTDGAKGKMQTLQSEIPLLEEALRTMLKHAAGQEGNPCYGEDVVAIFKAYAGRLFNYEAGAALQAYLAGNKAQYELHRDRSMAALRQVADVLAVCPSYSLNKTIAEASSVPGSNKFIPEMIRQACVNWQYTLNDVYEQLEGVYIPKTQAYYALLDGQMKKGEYPPMGPGFLMPTFSAIDQGFVKQGWRGEPRSGDPVKIVADSLGKLDATMKQIAEQKAAERGTMQLRQPVRGCSDFDVVFAGNDTPSFRVMAPHMIRAQGLEALTGLHMVVDEWTPTKDGIEGKFAAKDKVNLSVRITKGRQEIQVYVKVKNLTDKELKDVYAGVIISPGHLPGAPDWSNELFFPKAPLDRAVQGKIWYEKITPQGLKALTEGGWVPMHPKPEAPSAEGVPEYNVIRSKTPDAFGCAAATPGGASFLYETWNRPGYYLAPYPGNASMDMEVSISDSLAPGAEAEIRGVIGMHKGTWESLAKEISTFRSQKAK